ncbi:hypothetical protein OAU50_01445 [Planctomycetota bacterium]|nr:hypothetical protein [Planctomycetota bacterium]
MKRKRKSRKKTLPICSAVREGDGSDPRFDRLEAFNRQTHRKQLALCEQAARAIQITLASDVRDQELSELVLVRVVPAPNTTRLLVQLATIETTESSVDELTAKLNRPKSLFREEVAQAICRRKTPDVTFTVIPHELNI